MSPPPVVRLLNWVKGRGGLFWILIGLGLLASVFYTWSIYSGAGGDWGVLTDTGRYGYYGDMAHGFWQGHVYLPLPVDPVMLTAKFPWNLEEISDHFIWDLSFYKGHWYMYFGPGPCILLWFPWYVISGQNLNEPLAYLILCIANLVFYGLILSAFRRYYFPKCPIGWIAAFFFAFSMAAPMTFSFRYMAMYHIATVTGSLATLAMVYFVFIGLNRTRTAWIYFALSSLAWGFAFTSRPSHLFDCAAVFFAWLYLLTRQLNPGAGPLSRFMANTAAMVTPALICVIAMGWFNYERFGSPTELGQVYQTNSYDYFCAPTFSIHYIPARLYQYLAMPFWIYDVFPYIDCGRRPMFDFLIEAPGWEHMTGCLLSFPILLVAFFWIRNVSREPDAMTRYRWKVFGMILTAAVILPLLMLSAMTFLSYRYMSDFVPMLFVLTAYSFMARRHLGPIVPWQKVLYGLLLVATSYIGFGYSFMGDNNWIYCYYADHYHWPMPWENNN